MIEEKRRELSEAYRQWSGELQQNCPELINERYSYPYYLHIPDNWYQSKYRILIVGEEGYGEKKFDLPIEEAQLFNRDYLLSQLGKSVKYKHNGSAFWRRIRSIAQLMNDNGISYSITWTNLDKIHRSARKGNCRLKKEERESLHSTVTKILSKEIDILQPTHVIYFGWYGISLEKELPDVFSRLYPEGLGDDSQWKDEKTSKIQENGIWHIFTYHPAWGYRQKRNADGKGYEDKVLELITKSLDQDVPDAK